jgi:hypothetical protein
MPSPPPTVARQITAWIVVALTVVATWKFIDLRSQPPPVKAVITDQ